MLLHQDGAGALLLAGARPWRVRRLPVPCIACCASGVQGVGGRDRRGSAFLGRLVQSWDILSMVSCSAGARPALLRRLLVA